MNVKKVNAAMMGEVRYIIYWNNADSIIEGKGKTVPSLEGREWSCPSEEGI